MRPALFITWFIGCALSLNVQAQDLPTTLMLAYQRSPELKAAQAELRSIDTNLSSAQSGWRPSASIRADGGIGSTNYDNQATRNNPRSTSAQITQPLFRGGRTEAAVSQADYTILAGRAQLRNVEQKVLLEAATAYFDVARDQESLKLNRENVDALEGQLKGTNRRFEAGELTQTDVRQAELRLSSARTDVLTAESDLATARSAFLRLVGELPTQTQMITLELPMPLKAEEAALRASHDNPKVIVADYAERAAKEAIGVARGSLYPEIDLTADATKDWNNNNLNAFGSSVTQQRVIGTISIPLYQSGSEYAQLANRRETATQRRNDYDNQRLVASDQASALFDRLSTLRSSLKERDLQIEAAELALKGVTEESKSGTRTVLDVLDAEQEVRNSRINQVRTQRDTQVTTLQLAAAVGALSPQNLKLKGPFYDPKIHYDEVDGSWFGD